MKINTLFLCVLIGMVTFTSCKKSSTPAPGAGTTGTTGATGTTGTTGTTGVKLDTDVYIAGTTVAGNGINVAAYWKNGKLTKLTADTTEESGASGIAVEDINVYVVGQYYISFSKNIPVYWKINNKSENPLILPDSSANLDSQTTGIAVYNNSVYISGQMRGPNGFFYPVYWQGTNMPTQLANNLYSGVNGIAANAGGVYSVGLLYTTVENSAYWKGALRQTVKGDTTLPGAMSAITLVGTDIYTAGEVVSSTTHTQTATYWKNGDPTYISDGSNYNATAIAVKDGVVYTAGYETAANGYNVACYWKDKKLINLSDYNQNSSTTGIALIGNDVYVTGLFRDAHNKLIAVYWKNGEMKTLPGGTNTNGIVIVTHPHQ